MKRMVGCWSRRELLSLWCRFAGELTGKKVTIQIYSDYGTWSRRFFRLCGLSARFGGGACVSQRSGKHIIHLYVPETRWLEERFELFLHELAHIHLGHFGERKGSCLTKEVEADAWVAVNFSQELDAIDRFVGWERWQRDPESRRKRRPVTANVRRLIREQFGNWFLVTDAEKLLLESWLQEVRQRS